jgi:nitroreductase
METMKAILSRRSIRRYTEEPVSGDMIEDLLKAAMNAPSAGDEQPWHFIVIDRRPMLDKLADIHPYAKMLKQAPAAVIVCGDENMQKFKDFWVQDCSAASENMLLAAHALGLGAVWLGVFPAEKMVREIRELLNIPPNIIPFSIISVGHPAEEKESKERFDASRIHSNTW